MLYILQLYLYLLLYLASNCIFYVFAACLAAVVALVAPQAPADWLLIEF